jgi:hypothetical protein
MLNNFKRIFSDEKKVVVCFGDYEQIHKIAKIADDFYVPLKGYVSDP